MKTAKKLFLFAFLFALLLSIPFTISLLKKPQETRSRAATASTTLSFEPASTGTNPINKQVGDPIALDVIIDPGSNLVSSVTLQIKFDPNKIEISTSSPFTVNTEKFPYSLEEPTVGDGLLSGVFTIGADPTKAISSRTKLGTINLKAKGSTNGNSTLVTFTNENQVLSTGENDNFYESVLSSTTPATIVIGGSSSDITPGATGDPCAALNACPTPSIIPPSDANTTASFTILLHGVGSTGDNPNPLNGSLSNKAPLHPQRLLEVTLADISNNSVATISGAINYEEQSGTFKGSVAVPANIPAGKYSIKVKTPRYLRKRIPGIFEIKRDEDNRINEIDLVAGDTNNDNVLDILDYAAYLDCGYGALEPLPVEDANSLFNKPICQAHRPVENIDTDDNGIVDSSDYNLFIRELSVQSGD